MSGRTLVCGGRDYADRGAVYAALDRAHEREPIKILIHGGACGADALADDWGCERGLPRVVYRASWRLHGKAAGPMRNQRMIDEGMPDLVVAFPGGDGTADMVRRSERAGIPVERIGKVTNSGRGARLIFAGGHSAAPTTPRAVGEGSPGQTTEDEMATCKTVAELITALKGLPPSATVISPNPPFTGVDVIPQNNGSILITRPATTNDSEAERIGKVPTSSHAK